MTFSRFLSKAAIAGVVAVGLAFPAAAQTLADSLAAAYKNSGLLEQNRAVLRAADEDVAAAFARLRPVVNYTVQASYSDPVAPGGDNVNGSAAVSLSWLISDFGRSQLTTDLREEVVLATRQALVGVEQQVLLRAVNAHAAVLTNLALVELAENNLRVLSEQLRAERDRFDVGEVTRTDVSLTESRVAAARAQLAAARGGLERAREEYKAATGIEARRLADPPSPTIPGTPAEALAIARQRAPQLKQAQHNVTAAEIGILIAQAARRPTLNLNATAAIDDDSDDSASLGLSLTGPIYQGGGLSSALRKARADRDASRGALITTQSNIEQAVANAYVNLNVANASITAVNAQIEAAALALEGAREEQQLGARTTLDVLSFEQDLRDAQTDGITASSDRFVALYEILSASGLLTVENLGLDVPRYDPTIYFEAVRNAPAADVSARGERLDRALDSIFAE